MMRKFNKEKAIVYNTYQFYRHDKLDSIMDDNEVAVKENFILELNWYAVLIWKKNANVPKKKVIHRPFNLLKKPAIRTLNLALEYCIDNIKSIAFVSGTHNEESCRLLTELLEKNKIDHKHPHIYFAQLLGMSDNLSFNLADADYNVAKYVPYGPIKAVLPYLFRRAQENTAIAGQMSRELGLIVKEKERRKL
ncbi:proline dehydrogenase family protein [Mucilaginibacter humi]|uniref:proline dehydrogenase family protein n=1 Tax=Mucilaginibacter humi TaxID=2732510 RepID=UPI00293BF2C3|nr:proline dehydrogenase family protein [Mucilaginibacter humi]